MPQIDELHLNFPFAGARMLRDMLKLASVAEARQQMTRDFTFYNIIVLTHRSAE